MQQTFETTIRRYEIEAQQKWREEIADIPYLRFPPEWEVKIIPPFGDAVVRFKVRLPSGNLKSVYLDSRHSLGFYGSPSGDPVAYWEVYPHKGDVGRCERSDVAGLFEMIGHESIEGEMQDE